MRKKTFKGSIIRLTREENKGII